MTDDHGLAVALRQGLQLARELRAQGATPEARRAALENILRANWPATPPIDAWPWWARAPRCVRCDGSGLVITTERNHLGCVVEVGRPCTCPHGARYESRQAASAAPAAAAPAFTAAGKTDKGFSRW